MLIFTRVANETTTLTGVHVKVLAKRRFLVGQEVKNEFTRGSFAGKTIWIPVEEITRMIELGGAKPAKQ